VRVVCVTSTFFLASPSPTQHKEKFFGMLNLAMICRKKGFEVSYNVRRRA
jgi:hypothetical protein